MEENNKVIIFEKKEIIIVLVFVVVLIITSFTLGIRLGKKLVTQTPTPTSKEVSQDDPETVLKSSDEEAVDKALNEDSKLSDEEKLKKLMEESKSRLNDQLEKFSTPEKSAAAPVAPVPSENKAPVQDNKMVGKFTIQ